MSEYNIERFYNEHRIYYAQALREIRNGRKTSHWIWFIFPQLKFLGKSWPSTFYGMQSKEEAKAYYDDEYLGACLIEITAALLDCESDNAVEVMGVPDDKKLRSSMTLFYEATGDKLFSDVLDKFYGGKKDGRTLSWLNRYGK